MKTVEAPMSSAFRTFSSQSFREEAEASWTPNRNGGMRQNSHVPLPRSILRMTDEELEEFLRVERTVRIGTVSSDGEPHVAPLWFVWHDGAMYLNSLKRSRRSRDLAHG